MGILFWILLRTIIFSMIGNSFYKWFAGTTWGIWFDMKMKSILNKVTHKEEEKVKFKEAKKAATERYNAIKDRQETDVDSEQ